MPTGTQDGRKRLYLDFDGYFAAVEEQAAPALHGRPVAVLPYPEARTWVISANAAAKRHGVGTGTGMDEARRRCPGIALESQRSDLYVRCSAGPRARGRSIADVRAALRAVGVDVAEEAANEALALAFNDGEAEDMPLMAVRRGLHGPEVDAFRLEPHLH